MRNTQPGDENESGRRRRLDPLIRGLLDRLPPPGSTWPEAKRKDWLATLEANLDLVYPDDGTKPAPGSV